MAALKSYFLLHRLHFPWPVGMDGSRCRGGQLTADNNLDQGEREGRRKRAHTGQRPLWAPEDRDR